MCVFALQHSGRVGLQPQRLDFFPFWKRGGGSAVCVCGVCECGGGGGSCTVSRKGISR